MEKLRLGLQILAGFIFLFQMFRLLKEDYPEKQIVKASLLGLVLAFGFNYLNGYLKLNLNVWSLIFSAVIVVLIFSSQLEWRFWSVLELITWPGLVCLAVAFAGQLEGVFYLFLVLASFYWRNYRNFRWYPSGKAGFFFLINLSFLSVFFVGLDFWLQRLVELSVWSITLLAGISAIVLLSGRKTSS